MKKIVEASLRLGLVGAMAFGAASCSGEEAPDPPKTVRSPHTQNSPESIRPDCLIRYVILGSLVFSETEKAAAYRGVPPDDIDALRTDTPATLWRYVIDQSHELPTDKEATQLYIASTEIRRRIGMPVPPSEPFYVVNDVQVRTQAKDMGIGDTSFDLAPDRIAFQVGRELDWQCPEGTYPLTEPPVGPAPRTA